MWKIKKKLKWDYCQTKLKTLFYVYIWCNIMPKTFNYFLWFKSEITILCFAFKLLIYATMKKAICMLHYTLISWYRYRNTEDQNTNEKPLNLEEKSKMDLVVSRNETFFLAHLIYNGNFFRELVWGCLKAEWNGFGFLQTTAFLIDLL